MKSLRKQKSAHKPRRRVLTAVAKTLRQRRVIGDIVQIDLGHGVHSYARVLGEAGFAFYGCRAKTDLPIARVLSRPIIFQIAVMDYAVKKGRWRVVGNVPLERALLSPLPQFIQDAINPDQFSIYENGKIRPARRAECVGLECAAVWDPEHVEDRLRDHYAKRKNIWVESLKME